MAEKKQKQKTHYWNDKYKVIYVTHKSGNDLKEIVERTGIKLQFLIQQMIDAYKQKEGAK